MQTADIRTELALRISNCAGQRLRSGTLWDVPDLLHESRPLFVGEFMAAEGVDRLLGQRAELFVGEVLERRGDHPYVGGQRRLVEICQPGDQLALREVA